MQDEDLQAPKRRNGLRWGMIASVALHAIVVLPFFLTLSPRDLTPKEETSRWSLLPP